MDLINQEVDLSHNACFRISKELEPTTEYQPGVYRVILDEARVDQTVAAYIAPEEGGAHKKHGGRPQQAKTKRPRKKARNPCVGQLVWMQTDALRQLEQNHLLGQVDIERAFSSLIDMTPRPSKNPHKPRAPAPLVQLEGNAQVTPSDDQDHQSRKEELFERRKKVMAHFLSYAELRESILLHHGLGGLVREAVNTHNVSRTFVYSAFTRLCLYGFDTNSLGLDWPKCGAPGKSRPCDPGGRKKAGRKTINQRIAKLDGIDLPPEQPGMSSLWSAKIRAADKQIPNPKPSMAKRCHTIVMKAFAKVIDKDGKIEIVAPTTKGTYPNPRQIERVLTELTSTIQKILERTTKAHFERALRGSRGRNWEGVGGPGHQWAIDSTVGKIFLRSSLNRAWILGRPIVYVIVDVWSTAVVGFHVCLTGPSWNTAKLALFNAAADPRLIAELCGYEAVCTLNPLPSLPFQLLCDRGEYLSQQHRVTAMKLLPLTSYTAPYRPAEKRLEILREHASRLTHDAIEKASGPTPSMSEARAAEVAAATHPTGSESATVEAAKDEALAAYEEAMRDVLQFPT